MQTEAAMRATFDFYYFSPKSIRSELKIIAPFVSDCLIAMAMTWCAGCLVVQHISSSPRCVLVCVVVEMKVFLPHPLAGLTSWAVLQLATILAAKGNLCCNVQGHV